MHRRLRKLGLYGFVIAIVISLVSLSFVQDEANQNELRNYTALQKTHLLELENYDLLMNEENLSFEIYDKNLDLTYYSGRRVDDDGINSQTWTTFLSEGLTVGYFKDNRIIQRSYTTLKGSTNFTYSPNGVKMKINLKDIGVELEMHLHLSDDGVLSIDIPGDKIVEKKKTEAVLTHIIPYPCFASSYGLQDDGYIFIPDGAGALINLGQDTIATKQYSERVYGDDIGILGHNGVLRNASTNPLKMVAMPVYGINYEDAGGMLSIINKGKEYASINASVKGIDRINYNYAYTQFYLREQYFKYVDKEGNGSITLLENPYVYDINLKIHLLEPKTNIAKMAQIYREYLINNNLLTKNISTNEEISMRLQFLMSENKPNIFGNAETTTSKVTSLQEYVDELYKNNVKNINVSALGYQKGGFSNPHYSRFSLSKNNNASHYLDLKNTLDNGSLSFAFDYGLIYQEARGYSPNDIAKTISNQEIYTFDKLTYPNEQNLEKRVLLNIAKIKEKFSLDEKELQKQIDQDVQIDISDLSNILYSSHFAYSASRKEVQNDYVALLKEANVKVNLSMPNDYMLSRANSVIDTDLDNSGFYIGFESVPFYQMVLSGYLNMYSKPLNLNYNRQSILKLIDYNVYPNFLLTEEDAIELFNTNSEYLFSSQMNQWQDKVILTYQEINNVLKHFQDTFVLNRIKLATGVYMTSYNNGFSLIVNYQKKPFTYDGKEVLAEGYLIIENV